jgi:branched-chain amino acid transport system ATP-binding protein
VTARAAGAAGPLLAVEGVSVRFGAVQALTDVSLEIGRGEVVAIIGPNGAGKTTLLNVISGFYHPYAGRILFEGADRTRLRPFEVASLGIARTFQNVALFSNMTVLENVLVGAHSRTRFFEEGAGRKRAAEALDLVDLGHLAKHMAASLPYPTLKRIELARALVSEPRLLLLDEPAGGLSHEEVTAFGDFLLELRERLKLTVLLVEHHMGLVMRVSETVHVLDFGKTIARGTPDEVRADPAVIEAYLGTEAEGEAA